MLHITVKMWYVTVKNIAYGIPSFFFFFCKKELLPWQVQYFFLKHLQSWKFKILSVENRLLWHVLIICAKIQ